MGLYKIVNQLTFKVWILVRYPLKFLQSLRSNKSTARKSHDYLLSATWKLTDRLNSVTVEWLLPKSGTGDTNKQTWDLEKQ